MPLIYDVGTLGLPLAGCKSYEPEPLDPETDLQRLQGQSPYAAVKRSSPEQVPKVLIASSRLTPPRPSGW